MPGEGNTILISPIESGLMRGERDRSVGLFLGLVD
jgi:hypothetical protein